MRRAGGMLGAVLGAIVKTVQPGMSGTDLSAQAARELKALGGTPAFLGYQGYPDVLCISVNDGVVHGIPTDRTFRVGDIASFDFGVQIGGMVTDGATTVVVGEAPRGDKKRLIEATQTSLQVGLAQVKDGATTGDIGAAIEAVLAQAKLGIVRDLVGHGVGYDLHEPPDIANYGRAGKGAVLQAGMTIAIEPMATLGGEAIAVGSDGWTICTRDGSSAAHFEHTVLVTKEGYEVLTPIL